MKKIFKKKGKSIDNWFKFGKVSIEDIPIMGWE